MEVPPKPGWSNEEKGIYSSPSECSSQKDKVSFLWSDFRQASVGHAGQSLISADETTNCRGFTDLLLRSVCETPELTSRAKITDEAGKHLLQCCIKRIKAPYPQAKKVLSKGRKNVASQGWNETAQEQGDVFSQMRLDQPELTANSNPDFCGGLGIPALFKVVVNRCMSSEGSMTAVIVLVSSSYFVRRNQAQASRRVHLSSDWNFFMCFTAGLLWV